MDKNKEKIVGFQTDKPLKRALMPYGGIRMAEKACRDNGYELDAGVKEFFEELSKNKKIKQKTVAYFLKNV